MYRIEKNANRITKIKAVTFSQLGFTERKHLQEWLAHQPDALREDLLIIQKEFDGFDNTRERLDLLAIDKFGALVVIENKLDDSGRDVVWQAIKYASYCSSLSKTQIAEIFQSFLDKEVLGRDAKGLICDFLGREDFEEVELNQGNDQRVIFVAAEFRKEVTSTVLWLLKHRIHIKCFKANVYEDGDRLLLSVEQLIPLPEVEELMIRISEKEFEEQKVERDQSARDLLRTDMWRQILGGLQKAGIELYGNVAPGRDHWLSAGSGLSGAHYTLVVTKSEARVEFVFDCPSKERNKFMFSSLAERSDDLDRIFGRALVWDLLGEKKASIIRARAPFDGHSKETWPEMICWFVENLRCMEKLVSAELPGLRAALQRYVDDAV